MSKKKRTKIFHSVVAYNQNDVFSRAALKLDHHSAKTYYPGKQRFCKIYPQKDFRYNMITAVNLIKGALPC